MLIVSMLICVASVHAQNATYDSGLLIERLRQQQDIAQLQTLAAQNKDQTQASYAALCARLITARSKADTQAITAIVAELRQLRDDHVLAPLWAMLSVEVQFYDLWATQPIDPSLMVQLGYPTMLEQTQVAQRISLMYAQLSSAMGQLERYPVDIRPVLQQRCGFLLGLSAYIHALCSEQANRVPLLNQAHASLAHLLNTTRDDWQMMHRARWLNVAILLAMGQIDAAARSAPAIEADSLSMLMRARLLLAQKQFDQAYASLSKLETQIKADDPAMQLVVADTMHQLGLQTNDMGRAFGMYLRLLADHPSPMIKDALATRWLMKQVTGPNLASLPDDVLYACASQMFELAKSQDAMHQQALTLAASCLILLRDRPSVMQGPLADRVQLLWAILKPQYEPDEPQKALDSLSMLTYLAEHSTDAPLVYQAIDAAMNLCRQLLNMADNDLRARVLVAYQPLARLLFDRFNTSELADNSRLFDVVAVRLPAGEYALALQRLGDLPVSHVQYWLAQRYLLGIYRKLSGQADWPDARIAAAIRPIRELAVSQLPRATAADHALIKQVALEASGMLWQFALRQQQWAQAAAQLQWLETQTDIQPKVRLTWLSRRLLSLQQAQQWTMTYELAKLMLEQFGHDAFAVVMQVLDSMDQQLELQRHQAMTDSAKHLNKAQVDATMMLAQSVVTWASVHIADEKQLLLAKLIWARSLCDAGKMHDALAMLSPLNEQFEAEPQLWLMLAECHFKLALPANYQQAARLYHQTITRSLPDADGMYPGWYWQAWARYLTICDLTAQHTDIILSRISNLQAEDQQLGGVPWRTVLMQLAAKYQTRQPTAK